MKKQILQFCKMVKVDEYSDLGHAEVGQFMLKEVSMVIITNMKIAIVTTQAQFDAYLQPNRTYIQDIFPELTGMERQFIQSGMFFGKFDGKSFEKAYQQINSANEIIKILP